MILRPKVTSSHALWVICLGIVSPKHCIMRHSAHVLCGILAYCKYLANVVSHQDIAHSSIHNYRNSTSAMTVCYTYCMYMCVCVLPLSQLSTHHSGISVIPAVTADGSPHTFRYTSTVPSSLDLPPCSRKEPAAHKVSELNLRVLLNFPAQAGDKM